MDMSGSRHLPADRATVWACLNDPDVLRDCIPGCQSLSGSVEEGFTATVRQKIGPVKATFHGEVTISDVVPLEGYRLEGSGKGGVAGFASGGATVQLSDAEGGGTLLVYDVNAKVGGKIAQLGGRLIDGVARKLSDAFFDEFAERVATGKEEGVTG